MLLIKRGLIEPLKKSFLAATKGCQDYLLLFFHVVQTLVDSI